mmetsp:Transcript_8062/g.17531  ORF Transcript_8062/g.17531 Transcript_8062/m.17531 type:complete len:515 (-) Transcript_8062:84-1628(-)
MTLIPIPAVIVVGTRSRCNIGSCMGSCPSLPCSIDNDNNIQFRCPRKRRRATTVRDYAVVVVVSIMASSWHRATTAAATKNEVFIPLPRKTTTTSSTRRGYVPRGKIGWMRPTGRLARRINFGIRGGENDGNVIPLSGVEKNIESGEDDDKTDVLLDSVATCLDITCLVNFKLDRGRRLRSKLEREHNAVAPRMESPPPSPSLPPPFQVYGDVGGSLPVRPPPPPPPPEQPLQEEEVLTMFHAERSSDGGPGCYGPDLCAFLRNLRRHVFTECPKEIYIIALAYLDRACTRIAVSGGSVVETNKEVPPLTPRTVHRLYLAALSLAARLLYDPSQAIRAEDGIIFPPIMLSEGGSSELSAWEIFAERISKEVETRHGVSRLALAAMERRMTRALAGVDGTDGSASMFGVGNPGGVNISSEEVGRWAVSLQDMMETYERGDEQPIAGIDNHGAGGNGTRDAADSRKHEGLPPNFYESGTGVPSPIHVGGVDHVAPPPPPPPPPPYDSQPWHQAAAP